MNLFGKKKQAPPVPVPSITQSIGVLNDAKVQLEKRQNHLTKQIALTRNAARAKLKAGDKRGALQLLKKSKLMDSEVSKSDGKIFNIETQINALQNAASNKDILNAMRTGKDALKAATLPQDVDNVADVMDEINESIAMADELGEALSQPIGPVMDDDELTKELEDMQSDLQDEDLAAINETPTVPAVTTQTAERVAAPSSSTTTATQQRQPVTTNTINSLPTPSTQRPQQQPAQKSKLSQAEQDELKSLEALMS